MTASQLTLEAAFLNLEDNCFDWLQWARGQAQTISLIRGSVTSDDLRTKADKYGLNPASSHSWGAVFVGPGWTRVGRKASTVKANRCRWINVWRWNG